MTEQTLREIAGPLFFAMLSLHGSQAAALPTGSQSGCYRASLMRARRPRRSPHDVYAGIGLKRSCSFTAVMETGMYSAFAGTFFLLSVGILMAHAMEGLVLKSDTSERDLAKERLDL